MKFSHIFVVVLSDGVRLIRYTKVKAVWNYNMFQCVCVHVPVCILHNYLYVCAGGGQRTQVTFISHYLPELTKKTKVAGQGATGILCSSLR